MKTVYKTLFLIIALSILSTSSFAQASVTFQIDLKKQLKDSVFIPSEHSIVIVGNKLPFTRTNSFELQDKAPIDSVYSVGIRFPSHVTGEKLEYNYVIKRPSGDLEESRARFLPLREGNRVMYMAYFNNFPR